ncbi:PD-(D/E)XK motif protein [Oceanobacter sp. 4_MG-2023]|uniref:PD-(D/E)XK motif protein n=1 Tax=Oceanobacter sp. 4_MG-2023 TaxID=3062623 RepID=UPI002733BE2C|nr:PD-(D/E)XK motif protein [Oceanobacter sp. 4_MG-2023]MDP2546900.1 PD-(D/E)XK motif protein [Oceanobacter sp. 4_MG-2023]
MMKKIMMHDSPWDEISVPHQDLHTRRLTHQTAVPCFWGRDTNGNCLFIIELTGNLIPQYRLGLIPVKGVSIDLRGESIHSPKQRLILTLEKQTDRDIFESLCQTLAIALEKASDSVSSLAITFAHLRRWKVFLAGRNHHMSPRQVLGLFAEITFLLELLEQDKSKDYALQSWLGPEMSHQDFIYGNTSVEIKAISGIERNSVNISSEDQLESLNDNLFLRIYRLSSLSESKNAQSLNNIIESVYCTLNDPDDIDNFNEKLSLYGYTPIAIYDKPCFLVNECRTYKINHDFPRIIRSEISSGLTNVKYDINLESITSFECDRAHVFKE